MRWSGGETWILEKIPLTFLVKDCDFGWFWNGLNTCSETMWFGGCVGPLSTHGPSGTSHQSSLPFATPSLLDELQPGHIWGDLSTGKNPCWFHGETWETMIDYENPLQLASSTTPRCHPTFKRWEVESVELPLLASVKHCGGTACSQPPRDHVLVPSFLVRTFIKSKLNGPPRAARLVTKKWLWTTSTYSWTLPSRNLQGLL